MNTVKIGMAAVALAMTISGSVFAEERPVKVGFKAETSVAEVNFVQPNASTPDVKNPHKKDFIVEMRDMMGKYVYTTAAAAGEKGQLKYDIDMPPVANGVYYYNILSNEGEIQTSGKLVKE